MATQPTLGGVTLPHPASDDGFSYRREYRGGQRTMADGTTVIDLVNANAKHAFTLRWKGLTSSDRNAVQNGFAAVKDTSGTFLSPENVSYTVSPDPDSRELDITVYMVAGGTLRYDVTLRLREE